jgi:hypothetical protein
VGKPHKKVTSNNKSVTSDENNMTRKFLILLTTILVAACNRTDYLEQALKLAGDNRAELERVLEYYKKNPVDSLKLRAAVFLIENMPGHYSYKNPRRLDAYYDEVERSVDVLKDHLENKRVIEEISARYSDTESREKVWDIQFMKARYLVDHIERSFRAWQQGEWSTHVSFDDFCEYILPYKGCELQAIDNWREYADSIFRGDMDTLHHCGLYKNSAYWAVSAVNNEIIKANTQPDPKVGGLPILRISTLAKQPFGSCDDYALLSLGLMRSKGIPVVTDFVHQWPFRSGKHSWSVVLTNRGRNVEFPAGFANPGEPHKPDERRGKVFRRTYAINREITALCASEKYVPPAFAAPFIKDVTDEYVTTCDVELKIPSKFRKSFKYAYLAVFDNKNWTPVHYGKINGKKVVFTRMEKNCLYLPVCWSEKGIVPFADPFVIDYTGKVRTYKTDENRTQTLSVFRKYYVSNHCYNVGNRLASGRFEASGSENFGDSVVIHRVPGFTVQSRAIARPGFGNAYRYWRYYSGDGQHNNIAEIYFYKKDSPEAVYGQVIGTDGNENKAAFDKDPLTYCNASAPSDSWVGMDFGEPVQIEKIWYTPRSDGNDVTPGDEHELMYWSPQGWVSLGKKKAFEPVLVYEQVPTGGLYLLHNHSRGAEERIFTYEKEEQIFW